MGGGSSDQLAVSRSRRARGARQSLPQPLTEEQAGKAFVKGALEKSL